MDDVDRKIISQLQLNGRTTLQELAKTVGFTSMGTKKRLQKLLDQNMIKVSALINSAELELYPAVIMLEMESADAMQNVIERFRDCPPSNSHFQNNWRLQPHRHCCRGKPEYA